MQQEEATTKARKRSERRKNVVCLNLCSHEKKRQRSLIFLKKEQDGVPGRVMRKNRSPPLLLPAGVKTARCSKPAEQASITYEANDQPYR